MLNFILTYVKGLVKMAFYHRFILGPLLTAAGLLGHGLMVGYGVIPNSAAGLYLLFLLSGFIGGLRAGLVSAAMLAGYNVLFLGPITPERAVVILSYFAAAALVGWKTRQWRQAVADALAGWHEAEKNRRAAEIVDSVNGNIRLTLTAIETLDQVRDGWQVLPSADRLRLIEEARGKLADLVTLARSFHQMAEERRVVLGREDRT